MRVVHARYSLENSVFFRGEYFFCHWIFLLTGLWSEWGWSLLRKLQEVQFSGKHIQNSWHWLLKWQCVMLLKVYQVRNCHGFSDEDRTRIYHIAAMQLWWEKMGTFIMKSNSIYMNNTGDLLSGTLNRVHGQVLSADHYFGSGNTLGFRVNNMSWNHGIDYWKYHVLCS